MNRTVSQATKNLLLFLISPLLCATLALAQPYGYDDYEYDRRNDYQRERTQEERWKIERERDRLSDERADLEQQRRDIERQKRELATAPAPVAERCPSGFSPSEQKCSREERRRGCKDMRLPGGLGCVKR